jgi:hypothetical protein
VIHAFARSIEPANNFRYNAQRHDTHVYFGVVLVDIRLLAFHSSVFTTSLASLVANISTIDILSNYDASSWAQFTSRSGEGNLEGGDGFVRAGLSRIHGRIQPSIRMCILHSRCDWGEYLPKWLFLSRLKLITAVAALQSHHLNRSSEEVLAKAVCDTVHLAVIAASDPRVVDMPEVHHDLKELTM